MKAITILSLILCTFTHVASAAITVNFDELSTYTATTLTGSYYNGYSGGVDNSNGWNSGGAFFSNTNGVNFGYPYWYGWSYSNVNDTITAGFGNQYASVTGTGIGGSGNYAIAYDDGVYFNLPTDQRIETLSISNTTYTYFTMRDGNQFSTKFGGPNGNEPDFFKVTFNGFSELGATGSSTGSTDFYLADFRNNNNTPNYIVNDWRSVNLTGLGNARSISLTFDGSDKGDFGLNTPKFAAFDNIVFSAVPEPSSFALLGSLVIALTLHRSRRKRFPASTKARGYSPS